jgi:hypothetical protein
MRKKERLERVIKKESQTQGKQRKLGRWLWAGHGKMKMNSRFTKQSETSRMMRGIISKLKK